jgi:hypothetical protein
VPVRVRGVGAGIPAEAEVTYLLYVSFLFNTVFVLFWVFSRLRDPVPPIRDGRLLFLRRKAEKFRSLDYSETNELFNAIAKSENR